MKGLTELKLYVYYLLAYLLTLESFEHLYSSTYNVLYECLGLPLTVANLTPLHQVGVERRRNFLSETFFNYELIKQIMTKRLICKNCGADNHFGNMNCKDCEQCLD